MRTAISAVECVVSVQNLVMVMVECRERAAAAAQQTHARTQYPVRQPIVVPFAQRNKKGACGLSIRLGKRPLLCIG